MLPLLRSSLWAGAVMIFLQCFGAFSVPLIAGGNWQPIGVKIYTVANVFLDWPQASAMAVVMGVIQAVTGDRLSGDRTRRASRMRTLPAAAARDPGGAFVLFISLPLVMILLEAFGADWFGKRMLPGQWTLRWFVWAAQTVDLGGVAAQHRRDRAADDRVHAGRRHSRGLGDRALPAAAQIDPDRGHPVSAHDPRNHLRAWCRAHLLRHPSDQHDDRHRAGTRDAGGARSPCWCWSAPSRAWMRGFWRPAP